MKSFCIILAVLVAPVCFIAKGLFDRNELLSNGITVNFWQPDDAEIFTDRDLWRKEFPTNKWGLLYFQTQDLQGYKEAFVSDKHKVFVCPDYVTYATRQEKVVVSVRVDDSSSYWDWVQSNTATNVGRGKVHFEVKGSIVGIIVRIFRGVFNGFLVDLVLTIVAILVWMFASKGIYESMD